MTTFGPGRAQQAQEPPTQRFGHLDEWLNAPWLNECWRDIRQEAAAGVDRLSVQADERHLAEHMHHLVERLKRQPYRAKRGRRQYIPNGDGKLRPWGIPAVEDTLRQRAVTRIRPAIDAPDVLRCRAGDRPYVGASDAVDRLTIKRPCGRYTLVVEADIKGCLDTIAPGWVVRMVAERIEAGACLRHIQKWLKAGVLDTDGQVLHPATGTPQGGSRSPLLANVSLPDALDLWVHQVVKPRCRGAACLMRDADDFVCAFQQQVDAERFSRALGQRLRPFGLEVSADQTRVIPCSHTSCAFLGVECRWGQDRTGKTHLKRRTSRKKRSTTAGQASSQPGRTATGTDPRSEGPTEAAGGVRTGACVRPAFEVDAQPIFKPYFERAGVNPADVSGRAFELVVAAWLGDLIRLAEQPENLSNGQSWLVETGLLDAVKNGRIEYEVAT